jgi:hypothetical protein
MLKGYTGRTGIANEKLDFFQFCGLWAILEKVALVVWNPHQVRE